MERLVSKPTRADFATAHCRQLAIELAIDCNAACRPGAAPVLLRRLMRRAQTRVLALGEASGRSRPRPDRKPAPAPDPGGSRRPNTPMFMSRSRCGRKSNKRGSRVYEDSGRGRTLGETTAARDQRAAAGATGWIATRAQQPPPHDRGAAAAALLDDLHACAGGSRNVDGVRSWRRIARNPRAKVIPTL